MDQAKFLEIANYVTGLKMYPYFDAAGYIVMCMMVRDDSHPQGHAGSTTFSRKQPLACWISSMLMCFSGSILSNFLVGEGIMAPFKHQKDLLLATAIWYAINYSPFDLIYKLCKFPPLRVILSCMKQIQTVDKVHHGVSYTLKKHPGTYVIPCLIGVTKGAGYCYMRVVERFVRGVWTPSSHEILQPSFSSKACLAASIVFISQHLGYFSAPYAVIYLSVVIFFVYFSISAQILGIHDPFHPFEKIICTVVFGGLVDAIGGMFSKGDRPAPSADTDGKQKDE